jgi:hypothetical protein
MATRKDMRKQQVAAADTAHPETVTTITTIMKEAEAEMDVVLEIMEVAVQEDRMVVIPMDGVITHKAVQTMLVEIQTTMTTEVMVMVDGSEIQKGTLKRLVKDGKAETITMAEEAMVTTVVIQVTIGIIITTPEVVMDAVGMVTQKDMLKLHVKDGKTVNINFNKLKDCLSAVL